MFNTQEAKPKPSIVKTALDFLVNGPKQETDLDLWVKSILPHLILGKELLTRQAHDLRFLPKGYVFNKAETPEAESRNLFAAGADHFVTITGGISVRDMLDPERAAWLQKYQQEIGKLILDPNASWQDCQRILKMLVTYLHPYIEAKRLKALQLVGRVTAGPDVDSPQEKSISLNVIPGDIQDTVLPFYLWPVQLFSDLGSEDTSRRLRNGMSYTEQRIIEHLLAAGYNFKTPVRK